MPRSPLPRPGFFQYLLAVPRSLVHLLWMGFFLVPYAGWLILQALLGVRGEPLYRIGVAWLDLCVKGARWITGIDYRVQGMENLPRPGEYPGVVLLVKHQSTYETFLMPLVLRHIVLAYVFKKELLSIPFFGWGIGRMDMIHIDRSQKAKAFHKVIEQGKKLLAKGSWIIMFPEGTRVPRGETGQYRSSGARLAIETGSVVVPVAVTSGRCWPGRAIVKFPGVVDVSIGAPIASAGENATDLTQKVQDWIEAEMRRLDPDAYAPRPD
ncbi:1-acyl-sn-glycerol-3-phosphate acyltransferase [Lampropedia hyalina DSM 16112]|jgi:1-acyl-sn-glycerol-3-phosphate acyltransferase|uniref:1-acyl-sn-glycerol-3-phosphate acyltransferase n=1 Tax=Lampropedia hyalina DSM 16112 TaxID=1122156 RepID=A0A1M4TEB4_9BURK|nr:1-acyl-sn-glycerol-3-phosphate acyltransferase [Lampropedia hyalina DSM 16112]